MEPRQLVMGAMLVGAGMVAGSIMTGTANAEPQPAMRNALQHLKQAEGALQNGTADKGGHRVKALGLVRSAISELQAGVKFDNRH